MAAICFKDQKAGCAGYLEEQQEWIQMLAGLLWEGRGAHHHCHDSRRGNGRCADVPNYVDDSRPCLRDCHVNHQLGAFIECTALT